MITDEIKTVARSELGVLGPDCVCIGSHCALEHPLSAAAERDAALSWRRHIELRAGFVAAGTGPSRVAVALEERVVPVERETVPRPRQLTGQQPNGCRCPLPVPVACARAHGAKRHGGACQAAVCLGIV